MDKMRKLICTGLALLMVVTQLNVDFSYAEEAIGPKTETQENIGAAVSDPGISHDQTGASGAGDEIAADTGDGTVDNARGGFGDETAVVSGGETSNGSKGAVIHESLEGDIEVSLLFLPEENESTCLDVTLRLQSRTAVFTIENNGWKEYGEWEDVADSDVDLKAEDIDIDATVHYTFENLPLQTVGEGGVYQNRTQYRVIETKVDGADLGFSKINDSGKRIYSTAEGQKGILANNYEVEISEDAVLFVEGVNDEVIGGTATIATTKVPASARLKAPLSQLFDLLSGMGAMTQTYTVYNTSYHYADDETVTYTLSQDATVIIGDSSHTVAKNTPFTVSKDATEFKIESPATTIVVSLDATATGCIVMSDNPQTLFIDGGIPSTATFVSQKTASSVDLFKNWQDGSEPDKDIDGIAFALQFRVAGGAWTSLTPENMGTLGYTSLPRVEVGDHEGNDSQWRFNFTKKLYTKDAEGNDVAYRLSEVSVPGKYAAMYCSEGDEGVVLDENGSLLANVLKAPFSATKIWSDGQNSYTSRPGIESWLGGLSLKRASQTEEETTVSLSDNPSDEGYISIIETGDNTWSISLPNTLAYDLQGFPYRYYISEPTETAVVSTAAVPEGTVYKNTNKNTGNVASATNVLYNGDTSTGLLSNTMVYEATKQWKDDGSEETKAARPNTTLTLYRYPGNGVINYQNASPVSGNVTVSIPKTAASGEDIAVVLPIDGSKLPVFNEDGYQYVYYAKEKLSGGSNTYNQVFVDNGSEYGNDKFLFNGGELHNTITGTVSRTGTKIWIGKARQDVDAHVSMVLRQTDPDTAAEVEFETKSLEGFGAETVSKTVTFSNLPKYNEEGHKYTYTVSETGVRTKVGGEFKDATFIDVDGTTYIVTADGYRYRQDTVTDPDGDTMIKNVLVGNTELEINKTFPNGLLANPTTLTYTVYRNGVSIGTKTVIYEGEIDGKSYTPEAITIKRHSDLDGNTDDTLLPRYGESGNQYRYTVVETNISPSGIYGVWSKTTTEEKTYSDDTPDYGGEKYNTTVTNVSNALPGSGLGITVHKQWIDDGDTMYHEAVTSELQYYDEAGWGTVASGVIETSEDYVYMGIPTQYQERYRNWVAQGNEKPLDGFGAFRVVETKLGDNMVKESLTPEEALEHPEHREGWSFVSTQNQNYDVSPTAECDGSGFEYTLANKRVGVVYIDLTKVWTGDSGTPEKRPASIEFTVTASEAVFQDGSGKMTTMNSYELNDSNGWALKTEALRKYNDEGEIITYSVDEGPFIYAEGAEDYSDHYSKSKTHVGYLVGPRHTGDIDTYKFTNTLGGSVVPLMNKIWKDDGTPATIAARPDIYPILFYSYTDSSGVTHTSQVSGYIDRDWATYRITHDWWQCVFAAQPRYHPEGYEYTYYVGEGYSSVSTRDYVCSGGYTDSPDEVTGSFSEYIDAASEIQKDTVSLTLNDGTRYHVAKLINESGESGTLVNKLVGDRSILGIKVWRNLPASFQKTYLPDVTLELYRYLSGENESNAVDTGSTAVLKSGATNFLFEGNFPKYNNEGRLYTYMVKESDPTGMDIAYTLTNEFTNNIVATNGYKADQNYSVSFTKNWDGVPSDLSDAQMPTAKLTLVRYLTDKNGTVVAGTRAVVSADRGELSGSSNPVTIDSDTVNVGWGDLAYYAPNGYPYEYRVEESNIPNGFVVYDGTGTVPLSKNASGDYEAIVSGIYDDTAESGQGSAALTNKYGEVIGRTSVKKTWGAPDDEYQDISIRPTGIVANLHRNSLAFGEELIKEGIELNDGNGWAATVSDLQIYAPNGEAYKYYFVEEVDAISNTLNEGYGNPVYSSSAGSGKSVPKDAWVTASADASLATVTVTVTNTPKTVSLAVAKKWMDGSDKVLDSRALLFENGLKGIPESMVFRVAYSTSEDKGITWSGWNALKTSGGSFVERTITLDAATGVYQPANVSNLPAATLDAAGEVLDVRYKAYEYRMVYRNSDGTTTAYNRPDSNFDDACSFGSIDSVGVLTPETTSAAYTTTVSNSIELQPITITKCWDDEYNRDGIRPGSLEFEITRTNVGSLGDTVSTRVTLSASTDKKDDNTWSATYYVPVYWNVDTGTESVYTVEELGTVAGYTGYFSQTGIKEGWSQVDLPDVRPIVDLGNTDTYGTAYFKNSKNALVFNITPAKEWRYNGSPINPATAVWFRDYLPDSLGFELQYRIDGTRDWTPVATRPNGDFTGITAIHTAQVDSTTGAITVSGWSDLPRRAYTGDIGRQQIYSYRVVEKLDSGSANLFAVTYSPNDIKGNTADGNSVATVKNTLNTTALSLKKSWVDSGNAYNTRPDSITYTIQYSGDGDNWELVPLDWLNGVSNPAVATKARSYAVDIPSLPKYAPDGTTQYRYRAVETGLVYGTTEISPGDFAVYSVSPASGSSFTNTLQTTSFSAQKIWGSDPMNINGAVKEVNVKLQHSIDEGTTWSDVTDSFGAVKTWAIENKNERTKTWNDLPKYDPVTGLTYAYRAIETGITVGSVTVLSVPTAGDPTGGIVGGFGYSSTTEANKTTVTNTAITGSLAVSKVWADDTDRDGIRPTSLSVALTAKAAGKPLSLEGVAASAVLDAENGWADATTWKTVPLADAAGNTITYTLTEDAAAGYTPAHEITGGATGNGQVTTATTTITTGTPTEVEFTNTHLPATMSVGATKVWADTGNASLTRPTTLTYTLQYTTTPDDAESWAPGVGLADTDAQQTVGVGDDAAGACAYTWNNLPVFLEGDSGTKLYYRVVEDSPNGYITTYNSDYVSGDAIDATENEPSITVTNTLITTGLTVEKLWSDPFGISDAVKSTSYKVERSLDGESWSEYKASGHVLRGTIDKDASDEAFSWESLPTFDLVGGQPWIYRASETGITVGSDYIEVSGDTVGGFTVTTSVPQSSTQQGWQNTVTNTAITGSLAVSKVWADDTDRDGIRPTSLSVALTAKAAGKPLSFEGVAASAVLDAENGWADATTWKTVPLADAAGNTITYTLTEDAAAGYTPAYEITGGATGNGQVTTATTTVTTGTPTEVEFTNTHLPATMSVGATKVWVDENNAYGDRPTSIQFTLYANYTDAGGKAVTEKVEQDGVENPATLTSADAIAGDTNRWTASWDALPVYKVGLVGKEITYTVEENPLAGYDPTTTGTVITNTMRYTSLTVAKAWGTDPLGIGDEVDSTTYKLQRKAEGGNWSDVVDSATGTAATQTVAKGIDTATFSLLPLYDALGSAYAYRALETHITLKGDGTVVPIVANGDDAESGTVGGYAYHTSTTGGSDKGYTTTITNTPITTSVKAEKVWDDADNQDGIRPEHVTFHLLQNNNPLDSAIYDKTLADGEVEWTGLPESNAKGEPYTYTVTEDTIEGYTTDITDTQDGYIVTNTHEPESTTVAATKIWNDENNVLNIRPSHVELTLYANYTDTDGSPVKEKVAHNEYGAPIDNPVSVSGDGDVWNRSWEDLSAFKPGLVGKKITYTVEETPISGYTTTYSQDNLTVENTLDPITFTFGKVDEDGTPLAGATFSLAGVFNEGGLPSEATIPLLSGEESESLINRLIIGQSYTLSETVAPAGRKNIQPVRLTCTIDGLRVQDPTGNTKVSIDESGHFITIRNDMVAVDFVKTDRMTGEVLSAHKQGIFLISPVNTTFADGSPTEIIGNDEYLTTALRGQLLVSQVENEESPSVPGAVRHVYSIKEIKAPGGYCLESEAVEFIVDQNGKIYALNGQDTIITSKAGDSKLEFSDNPTKISFVKVNEGGKCLDGAVLRISGVFADGSSVKTIEPKASGETALEELLIIGESYSLEEVKAPEGYDSIGHTAVFTLDDSGAVTLIDDAKGRASVSSDKSSITIVNAATKAAPKNLPSTGDIQSLIPLLFGLFGCSALFIGLYLDTSRRKVFKR